MSPNLSSEPQSIVRLHCKPRPTDLPLFIQKPPVANAWHDPIDIPILPQEVYALQPFRLPGVEPPYSKLTLFSLILPLFSPENSMHARAMMPDGAID